MVFLSKLPGFEGVSFRLKDPRLWTWLYCYAVENAITKANGLVSAQDRQTKDSARYKQLGDEAELVVRKELWPSLLRFGLHSIEGLEIDGEPATVESLIESGPPELFAEILREIHDTTANYRVKPTDQPNGQLHTGVAGFNYLN
jgi:hypothetical protein